MRASLKTEFTLAASLLVLAIAAVLSALWARNLTQTLVRQTHERAQLVAQQVFDQARLALHSSPERPRSTEPEEMRRYLRAVFENDAGMQAALTSSVDYWKALDEIAICDSAGVVLASNLPEKVGRVEPRRTEFRDIAEAGWLTQARAIYQRGTFFQVTYPLTLNRQPFGEIRVGLSGTFLNSQLIPQLQTTLGWALVAVLAATLVSSVGSRLALAPLARISQQLDGMSRGEFQTLRLDRTDELGQVSSQIDRLGQELSTYRTGYRSLKDNVDQIMTGLQEGLMLFSRDGHAIMVSPSVEKFLGVKPEALLRRSIQEIFPQGSSVARALGLPQPDLSPVENLEVELEGNPPHRAALSVQIIAERGEKLGALVTLRDLESIERLGSQFEITERLAAISRVTAGVAHEVKNPLNAMSLHLGQLRRKLPPDGNTAQHLQVLENEISRLNRAVDTFRNFTRPVELHLVDTDLHGLVMEVFALARPQAEAGRISIAVEQPQSLPLVRVDRDLLKQALLNLVLNGCQAMPGGGTLTISLRRDDHHVEILVKDTGAGIPPEDRKKIFQLFFSTKPGGSGIGLANTFRVVQLHNGSIDFNSEVGRGTTFRLRLPPR